METIETYIRQGRGRLHRWLLDPATHRLARSGAYLGAGFVLSAASLVNSPMTLALGLVCALTGAEAALAALGAAVGYLAFWNSPGAELGALLVPGLALALGLESREVAVRQPWLLPTLAGLLAAGGGIVSQYLRMAPDLGVYLLRIGLALGSTRVFSQVRRREDTLADWLAWGFGVLALAQVAPFGWSLGFPAAAAACVAGAFPAAALGGLALDLAGVTPVPMTAVLCLAWLCRLLPGRRGQGLAPALSYLPVMALCGLWDLSPLSGLVLGGLGARLLPKARAYTPRRGEVGVAQVRLELASAALGQMEGLLLELPLPEPDAGAVLELTRQEACGSCAARGSCRARQEPWDPDLVRLPSRETLPPGCRKPGRLFSALERGAGRLRLLSSNREKQLESRRALVQQYRLLGEYLQSLADSLGARGREPEARFRPEAVFRGSRSRAENGDRCMSFPGTGCRHYVVLCDGMGTGIGAADEAATALGLVRRLLEAGLPAAAVLESVSSLCALGEKAGAVTLDLLELQLDSGRAELYKWGAAPSYLVDKAGRVKLGAQTPPPGLRVGESCPRPQGLSLRRGEVLVMLSDGVTPGPWPGAETPSELARLLLEASDGTDDATVAVVRLEPLM